RNASADRSVNVPALSAISLTGGILGGLLLLLTPQPVFSRLVPWLILFATLIFAGGNFLVSDAKKFSLGQRGMFIVQGLVAIYGGYFCGGIGILMLAMLTLFGLRDIFFMKSVKIMLLALINASAAGTIILP